jgi:hypothetical protein
MPICPYDGCFTEIDAPPACIVHICDTAGCPNVKKYNYVMCDQHIYDDPKYKNEIFLRDQFNTTVRNVKPIIFQCDDSSIIQSVLVQPHQYTCCVCEEEIIGDIHHCVNYHSICIYCFANMEEHSQNTNCPVCRSPTLTRDFSTEAIVASVLRQCPNDGCQFKTFPIKMSEHICEYKNISCFECHKKTTPHDLQTHLKTGCVQTFREIKQKDNFALFVADRNKYGCRFYHENMLTVYMNKCQTFGITFYVVQLDSESTHNIKLNYFLNGKKYTRYLTAIHVADLGNKNYFGTHISQQTCWRWSPIQLEFS